MESVWFFIGWVGGTIAAYALMVMQRSRPVPLNEAPPESVSSAPRGQTMWD